MAGRSAVAALLLLAGCATAPLAPAAPTLDLVDAARSRRVPLTLYGGARRARPLALLLPGYGAVPNDYGFVARHLVARGFVVAALQLELPGDPVPASGSNLAVRRRPIWQVGADSAAFAIAELRVRGLATAAPAVVVGHSNGGDVAVLLAAQRPALLRAVVSLDNRRMPWPRVAAPRLCSARSSDFPADPGVLPSADEAARLGMRIVAVPVRHDDIGDRATPAQQAALLAVVDACLGR